MKRLGNQQLVRLLTSIAWVGGMMCLLAIFVGPAWYHLIHVRGLRADIEDATMAIAKAQQNELIVRERFLPFDTRSRKAADFSSSTDATGWLKDQRLVLSGWQQQNGNFLIRVVTRPEVIEKQWLPAILLERELDSSGKTVRMKWVEG